MSHKPLRLIFAGTPEFAGAHLDYLLGCDGLDVVAVYTQPDRPAGRGKKLTASPVKQLAQEHQLSVHQPQSLKSPEAQQQLAALQPDVMVVVAYGLILPQAVLAIPVHGCINVHASLLPRWRGAAPIQRAIEAGDGETGITIMQMDSGLDTGDMLHKVTCPIGETETAGQLHDRLLELGGPALHDVLQQIQTGQLIPQPQDSSLSTYADKITKAEARLDWQDGADELARKCRAFNPFPIAFFELEDKNVRVWKAQVSDGATAGTHRPGEIVSSDKNGIVIACGEGQLCLQELQMPGKKPMAVAALLNASRKQFAPGLVLA